jgi:hypothetical protein
MKIDVSYDELLDIANALKARADALERMPAPLDPAQRDIWQRAAASHRALADRLLTPNADGKRRDADQAHRRPRGPKAPPASGG